jgi:Zn-dependent protease with chaperone function
MPAKKKAQKSKYQTFPGIDPACFQHPSDLEALKKLSRLPAIQKLMRKLSVSYTEKMYRMLSLSERVRVSTKQCPDLYRFVEEACTVLDIKEMPEIYMSTKADPNAFAFGIQNFTLTLTTCMLDTMNEDELRFVIGHELSHIKCNHMMYRTLLYLLTEVGAAIFGMLFRVAAITFLPLEMKLRAWERKAELSSDRGGLLVVQDPKVAQTALIKMAGGASKSLLPRINLEEVMNQADELRGMDDEFWVRAMKVYHNAFRTHPFPIIRIKELHNWSQSNQYRRILNGDYPRL